MNTEVLRLAGSLAIAGAVMLTASAAVAGDWKKGRGHHKHYYRYDREVVYVPARPIYYAPRPVVVYPAPVYAPPVAYAPVYGPVYGPAYPRGGNLSIGVDVPLR